jgi:hypothetical protein
MRIPRVSEARRHTAQRRKRTEPHRPTRHLRRGSDAGKRVGSYTRTGVLIGSSSDHQLIPQLRAGVKPHLEPKSLQRPSGLCSAEPTPSAASRPRFLWAKELRVYQRDSASGSVSDASAPVEQVTHAVHKLVQVECSVHRHVDERDRRKRHSLETTLLKATLPDNATGQH